jgi:hypothetical protein
MKQIAKWRLFQKAAVGILVLYFGLMLYVTVIAHMRKSGSTGMDMGQVQLLRAEALKK